MIQEKVNQVIGQTAIIKKLGDSTKAQQEANEIKTKEISQNLAKESIDVKIADTESKANIKNMKNELSANDKQLNDLQLRYAAGGRNTDIEKFQAAHDELAGKIAAEKLKRKSLKMQMEGIKTRQNMISGGLE